MESFDGSMNGHWMVSSRSVGRICVYMRDMLRTAYNSLRSAMPPLELAAYRSLRVTQATVRPDLTRYELQ